MEAGLVVADTGPLHYLILVDCADVLELLFERVLIPGEVRSELSHPKAPDKVKNWISRNRSWFEVRELENPAAVRAFIKARQRFFNSLCI